MSAARSCATRMAAFSSARDGTRCAPPVDALILGPIRGCACGPRAGGRGRAEW